jgi:hypothetical protein
MYWLLFSPFACQFRSPADYFFIRSLVHAQSADTQDPGRLMVMPTVIPGYSGGNSYLYHRAMTKILERVLDRVFEKRISFLLDGTLASIDVAKRNISRVLASQRIAQVIYVYQEPMLAWQFVQAREITEGRNIPLDAFVAQYLAARRNVVELRKCYGDRFYVDLIIKNNDGTASFFEQGVSVGQIDALIPDPYDQFELVELLSGVKVHERS